MDRERRNSDLKTRSVRYDALLEIQRSRLQRKRILSKARPIPWKRETDSMPHLTADQMSRHTLLRYVSRTIALPRLGSVLPGNAARAAEATTAPRP